MTGHRYAYKLNEDLYSLLRIGGILGVLNAALVSPAAFASGWQSIGPADLISLDLALLLGVLVLAHGTQIQQVIRRLATGVYVFLLLYELYDAAMQVALKRPGLLYDDIQHIAGTVHLIGNAAMPLHVAAGAVGVVGIGGCCWFAVRAFRMVGDMLQVAFARRVMVLGACVSVVVTVYGLALDQGNFTPLYGGSMLLVGEKVTYNVVASVQLRQRVQAFSDLPTDSTYMQYDAVPLANRPHLFILFIESYGDVLRRNEETAAPYRAMMQELDERLSRDGWQSASTTSLAPVNGGTSWLSVGSLLMGMPIRHQSMFTMLEQQFGRYPHLIHTLQTKGYRTAVVQPPTRPRLGIGVSNPYEFDDTFYFADMRYTGPRYGWGIVPDQYSLHFAHEQLIARSEQPVALLFEMVASHSPWEPPPPLLNDWRAFNDQTEVMPPEARLAQPPVVNTGAAAPPLPNVSAEDNAPIHRLFRAIRYDWQVIADYMMNDMPDSSIVLVLGDHQPPIVKTNSDAVPVHLFSRTPSHMDAVVAHGFERGLWHQASSEADDSPAFRHAGLYSLLMNVLAHPPVGEAPSDLRASASRALPVLPEGVQRPAMRRPSAQ